MPIHDIVFSDSGDVARDNGICSLVSDMLKLAGQLQLTKTPHEKESLQRQIVAADGEIDQLVYQLYGLTDEEIRIVEEATAPAKS